MIFNGKNLIDLQEEDLQRLINDQIQERDIVEYKSAMYGNSDSEKKEMLKDITSMANHQGGYLVIGVEENGEGIPTNIIGVEPGNHKERITSICLNNVDKRIIGLEIHEITLLNGKLAIVISIPKSINIPHMITYQNINQFWKRHGRQKDKMTIDEIGEAFDKRLSNLNRLDRFLFTRKAKILEQINNKAEMIISSSPAYLTGEVIFNNQDSNLRQIILHAPHFSCGKPYPTINGLRADQSTPYHSSPSFTEYMEIFLNGYIEFGKYIEGTYDNGVYFASGVEIPYIVNFIHFIKDIYGQYLPLMPLVINFSILNAKGIWLAAGNNSSLNKNVKWKEQHLELEQFYINDISQEYKIKNKEICDRLYQAFNRDKCDLFDDNGTFKNRL